jgi:CubicO group peptidase (beta-lactamase class C family)
MPYFEYADGLGSTTNDLVNYIKLLFDKNNPIATLCLKKNADINASSGKIVPMRPDNTAAPDVYSAALNWFKYQPDSTSSQIWADGGTNGFNSYLVIYPNKNSGIVLLANKSDEKIFRALPDLAFQISKIPD